MGKSESPAGLGGADDLRLRLRGGMISPAASRWLSRTHNPELHNLFRRSLNLINEDRQLMSVVLPDIGPGPFAIVVHPEKADFSASGGFAGKLTVEDQVRLEDSGLIIGDLEIAHTNLPQWNPKPDWEQVDRGRLEPALEVLIGLLDRHAPEGSFAPLVGTSEERGARSRVSAAALEAAAAPAAALFEGLHTRDRSKLVEAASGLAGLGGGVTPSGDDFLMGAVHAMWMLLEAGEAGRLAAAVTEIAVPQTNAISGAWLQAAARGEAGNEWHILLYELVGGGPLVEAAVWLIGRGHTSGADALAGFLGAARAIMTP